MSVLDYQGYSARIEFDAEDEVFFGRIAGIRDSVSFHADNVADLKVAFHEAVEDYIETCTKIGKSPQKPYSGNLQFRVEPELHHRAAEAAELSGMSLNQWGECLLQQALTHEEARAVNPGRKVNVIRQRDGLFVAVAQTPCGEVGRRYATIKQAAMNGLGKEPGRYAAAKTVAGSALSLGHKTAKNKRAKTDERVRTQYQKAK
ncbi:type II toxin-antitoxin system HicB family antitoxin [Asticcacaulis sp. ZE23SCel15]|uniref:type II toxin-antitoxin system HicB family antitoxin n=1 Tax=Asticcacaulis sp. ZE23SCel15 TaxID=3059027 RepID=UPI00265ECED0|nr:type II toxin-antitoxin system HicB family antitoxin [Asticcacaulis sp. ZE23SCel15]WKL56680.1 type II toxin-antitoxin system HicB family antitoxin [Asticcacaulis sp. ZE23SCel15]